MPPSHDGWYRIRFPRPEESRSADFPPLDTFTSRGLHDICSWCERRCRGAWRWEVTPAEEIVFWFQQRADAMDFALTWFPFKCT